MSGGISGCPNWGWWGQSIHLCMKCSLGISNFLEEISSLSHSIVFFYFFALITEEGFLVSPCYSLDWVNLHVKFTNNFWRI